MAQNMVTGIPVSTGISVGRAFFVNRGLRGRLPRRMIRQEAVQEEINRLGAAFAEAETQLRAIRDRVPPELRDHKHIIDSHLMMLKDPNLSGSAEKMIASLAINAEWALEKAVDELEKVFAAISDPYIRGRMQDVRIVAEQVQTRLMGEEQDIQAMEGRAIILAHDLTPSDTIGLNVQKIMAIATTLGGKTSHTGILARTLGIPAVVGVEGLETTANDGDLVIIDGLKGKILVNPDEDELAQYADLQHQFEAYQKSIVRGCQLPAETIDGYRVQVLANIELAEELSTVIDNGGEGVGLYRTEYSYLNRTSLPTEEELYEEYLNLAATISPRRVIIRTLDIGADKFMSHFGPVDESNPALGLRAIRFCLRRRGLFRTQLRAILRASHVGNVSIMFPMISGLKEIRRAKSLMAEAQAELKADGLPFNPHMPVGIMVELPSAVMIAEILAQEVDFFSIGTNDLIQYSLGIDRTNQQVSYLYQPLHPAILRSIKQVVDAAHQVGIEVSLCGEVASDPFCVPILMGMQIDCISLTPKAIPGIKRIIRQASMEECVTLLKQVLHCRTVGRINRLVTETIFQSFPEELTFYASLLDTDDLGG
ncbi:MAG: phosphoenolpyruvate--protein phosphotransferase [Desulfovibrionaceae bacterium]